MEARVLNKCLFLCFTGEKYDPSYYRLNSNKTTACLATDFSAYNANEHLTFFNKTEATRVNGDSYYSQVALSDNCTEGKFQMMPNHSILPYVCALFVNITCINFLSLTILGLRILFLKTIVFNVLMTLRLWIS
uniref:Uncharacterized protein n=1 Tax=Hucho hucho TaxID=62062 RepID=A0A4W5NR51_9TELE